MKSKVIHVRLDDWAIIGCHDIVLSQGGDVGSLPISSVIRQVVNGLVRTMQNAEKIPTYTREDRLERLADLYSQDFKLTDLDIDPAMLAEITDDIEQSEEVAKKVDLSALAASVIEQLEGVDDPSDVASEVEIDESAERIEPEQVTIDLLTQPSDDFMDLRKRAPKDRLIEYASNENKVIQKAVAITYTMLPQDQWGSEKAEAMVLSLIERHKIGAAP